MAAWKVLEGDIARGKWEVSRQGTGCIEGPGGKLFFGDFSIAEPLTEERKAKLSAAAGWGTLGYLALGPLGAIGAAAIGGLKKRILLYVETASGQRFIAETDPETYARVRIAMPR